jgi:hypothetical protein
VSRQSAKKLSPTAKVVIGTVASLAAFAAVAAWWPPPPPPESCGVVAYTAPGETDSAYAMPPDVSDSILQCAKDKRPLDVIRIEADGKSSRQTIDLTPYVDGEAPTVEVRQVQVIKQTNDKLESLLADMNQPTPGTDARATYLGLVDAQPFSRFTETTPVWVFSTLLDTADPTNLRELSWAEEGTEQVLETIKNDEFIPTWLAGHEAVTFIRTAPAGPQELYPKDVTYVEGLFRGLMEQAGVKEVSFVAMPPSEAVSTEPIPPVSVSGVPETPTVSVNPDTGETTCAVTTTARFSLVNSREEVELLDRAALVADLRDCASHLSPEATVLCKGFTAWPGPLKADGQPVDNPANSIAISQRRAELVAQVLIEDFGMPGGQVKAEGFGNEGAPNPTDPASADNAVVIITITPPSALAA